MKVSREKSLTVLLIYTTTKVLYVSDINLVITLLWAIVIHESIFVNIWTFYSLWNFSASSTFLVFSVEDSLYSSRRVELHLLAIMVDYHWYCVRPSCQWQSWIIKMSLWHSKQQLKSLIICTGGSYDTNVLNVVNRWFVLHQSDLYTYLLWAMLK